MRLTYGFLTWLAAVLVIFHLTGRNQAAPANDAKTETAAEKCRRLLEQNVTVEYVDQSLTAVLDDLTTRTKVRFVLDRQALLMHGDEGDLSIRIKQQDVKAKNALRAMLRPIGMTYVILDDTVLVTTDEMASHRQFRQRVNVDLEDIPLANALKHLTRQTSVNLVVDPRLAKEARATPVTLLLEDVPLETAIKLIAEVGNLSSVRVGNVLFVTTPQHAERLRADPEIGGSGIDGQPVPYLRAVPAGGIGGVPQPPAVPMAVPPPPAVPPQAAPAPAR